MFLPAVLAGDVPAHPAALAEQTGAALMPVTLWYEGEELGRFIAPEQHERPSRDGHAERSDQPDLSG